MDSRDTSEPLTPNRSPKPPMMLRAADRIVGAVASASLAAQQWFDDRAAARAEAIAASRPFTTYPTLVARYGIGAVIGVFVVLQVLGVGRIGMTGIVTPPVETVPAEVITVEPLPEPTVNVPDPRPAAPDAPRITQDVRPAPPITLRIPAIEVDAPVVSVGLEPDGAMEIPADVRTVGWYEPFAGAGLTPGEPGTAVIAGHVDSRVQGRGAFWLLRELSPGDIVEVIHEDGTISAWRIESVVRYPKDDIPIEDIFTFEGPPRIALITCGGEFDRSIGSYLDNYVVTAVPIERISGARPLPGSPAP
jgi:hypothetical protein